MTEHSTTHPGFVHQPSSSTGQLDEGLELWRRALDALERHHGEVRGGLATGVMPEPYAVALPSVPLPTQLAQRARSLRAAQREIEDAVRARLSLIGTVLTGAFSGAAPGPYYLDRRG